MSKELLNEGAIAGHMNHIYDNGEMSFGELKQLLNAASAGQLRGTEKTDGQNIYLSFNIKTNKAVAVRNKTMIAAGGLDSEGMDIWFSNHASQPIRYSFVEAVKEFENTIIKLNLDPKTLRSIFGEGVEYDYSIKDVRKYSEWHQRYKEERKKIKDPRGAAKKARQLVEKDMGPEPVLSSKGELKYFNAEVMNPGNPEMSDEDPRGTGTTNVIPYDKKTLLFHRVGHQSYTSYLDGDKNKPSFTNIGEDMQSSFSKLEKVLQNEKTDNPAVFSIETNPVKKLPPLKDKEVLKATISKLEKLMKTMGMKSGNTINQYVIAQIGPQIERLNVSEPLKDLILLRIMDLEDEDSGAVPKLTDINKGLPEDTKEQVKELVNNFNYSNYTNSLQLALHDFSVAMIDGLDSSFIADNERAVFELQKIASEYKKTIENSSNEEAKEGLKKQWEKLKHIKNINTPSEGFVFDFNGVTYKFTGSFAPLNQIIGIRKYGRYGPIDNSEDALEPEDQSVEPSSGQTIAIFPGSFKPPHMGHLSALKELAAGADIAYVIVSKPEFSTRTLPKSQKSISADHAMQIWLALLDKTDIKDKVRVVIGNEASPITTTIKFVTLPADPEDPLVAPQNSTVILGVGRKDKDADRFNSKLVDDVREKRPDLTISPMPVGPFQHSPEYLNLLSSRPEISSGLNKGKGRSTPEELSDEERKEGKLADKHLYHASDMRYFIDLASEDPIGLNFLNYFVPAPEDSLAIMGILGINPADESNNEISNEEELNEIIFKYARIILEKRKRKSVKKNKSNKKSTGKFQKNMKKRLSKSHKIYLDSGRKDLIKFGKPFTSPRPVNKSNAFLAEDDLEEISMMGNGDISGGFKNKRKRGAKNANQ